MGIAEMNMISDFEAGMNCLQNPSLISSSFFSFSGIGRVSQVYSLWTWGALILAVVAIINRIKLVFITRLCKIKSLASAENLLQPFIGDSDFSDDGDDICSLPPSDDDDDGYSSTSSYEDRDDPVDEDFSVAGSSRWSDCSLGLRRRRIAESFSWSDFAAGKSVVKLWDSLGLGFDGDSSSDRVFSLWDLNSDSKLTSIFGGRSQIPAISTSSPAVVLSGGMSNRGDILFGALDRRIGSRSPAIYAEWRPAPEGGVSSIESDGLEKVYVMDDVTGALTVGDMRNVKTPLKSLTKSGRGKCE